MRTTCFILGIVSLLVLAASHGTLPAATYTVTNTTDSGPGSLRMAIATANANPGADRIEFDIPGAGPHMIQPATPLPEISDPVIIDGYTQPGASPNTNGTGLGNNAVLMIELDGSSAGHSALAYGLNITSGHSTVRGLAINRFSLTGIIVWYEGGNVIEGNYIGTDVTGSSSLGNGRNGVEVSSGSGNIIGGSTAAARNLISGNDGDGIWIYESSPATIIQGNFIGTDATGTYDLGNTGSGVNAHSADNQIGGLTPNERNVISGNDLYGIAIPASENSVLGNYIGTDVSGIFALGNDGNGVYILNFGSNNTIGPGNTIAFNGYNGIEIRIGTGNDIIANAIYANVELGIDLLFDWTGRGVTPNDVGDGDPGGNNFQNFPVLTSAYPGNIHGTLNSTPNTEFRIELFSNSQCDSSGHGEGERYLGGIMVTTTATGNVDFTFTPTAPISADMFITATATDPDGNTSEFSECIEVTSGLFDVGIAHIDFPSPVWHGYTLPATIGMINLGPEDAHGAMGSCSILDQDLNPLDGYPQAFGPFDIPAAETSIHHFQWAPPDTGTYFIRAHCEAEGDKNHDNDSLTVPVHVYDKSQGSVGDVNGDGQSNVIDAVYLINYILGIEEFSELELFRADCNRDGEKNILDVLGIINGILGISFCASACEELDCDDGNPCTFDYCDSTLVICVHEPLENGTPCNDGDECTEYDKCIDGTCQGTLKDCDDDDPCTADGCDPGRGCKYAELCCDNGSDDDGDGHPDCDDDDCLTDADSDGHYAPPCGNDCDDGNAAIHPGATEICTDGIDNDCDGPIDCNDDDCLVDADGDGYYVYPCGDDCNDGNNSVYPGAPEICTDGIDNDCDGPVDCNDDDCLVDADGDGYDAPPCGNDCDDGNQSVNPAATEICTDQTDNDCDGDTDCADSDCRIDADGDGHYAYPCGQDCDDGDNTVYPGAPEICNDGKDNNCDQAADCQDNTCWVDSDGDQYYAGPCGDDCDDGDQSVNPGAQEDCQDKKDNDCDGKTDCDDDDCANDPNCP